MKKYLLFSVIFFSLSPFAFAADDCVGVEPICDYPLVAVCVRQQQGYYGRQGQSQAIWVCQDKSHEGASNNKAKETIASGSTNPNPGFFPDGYVGGTDSGGKNGQRSDDLFAK